MRSEEHTVGGDRTSTYDHPSHDVPTPDASGVGAPLGLVDRLILSWPVLMCAGYAGTWLVFSSYTPRAGLLVAAGAPGLVGLAGLLRRGDGVARTAIVLIGWVFVAAVFSGAPLLALKGTVGRESTGLILVLAIGVWALGRRASAAVVGRLPLAVLAGFSLNAVIGFVQVVFQVESGTFALQFGRATALTPSPVYFGALMAAGAALSAGMTTWPLATRCAGAGAFGLMADLSGSRVAIVAAVVVAAFVLVPVEDGCSRRRRLALPLSVIVGVALSGALSSSVFDTRSSTVRLDSSGDSGGRLEAWGYGLRAVVDRPVFGWGLGRFRAATQGRFTADFVRRAAADDTTQAWFDAHNLVINTAVGLGVVGLVIATTFAVRAAWTARGPLLFVVLALALTMMLQPAGLVTLPLALFLLGAAATGDRPERHATVPAVRYLVAVLVATVSVAWLFVGDLTLRRAIDARRATAVEDAAVWYPNDSVVADLVAQAWFLRGLDDPAIRPTVIEWSERAVSYEPDRPYLWSRYAGRLMAFEERDEARRAFERGIELQPWHIQSWIVANFWAETYGDDDLLALSTERLCELGVDLYDSELACSYTVDPRP